MKPFRQFFSKTNCIRGISGFGAGHVVIQANTVTGSGGALTGIALEGSSNQFGNPGDPALATATGNDVEGLRYAVIDTPEKYWLAWREPSEIEDPLDRALRQLCSKERLLERIHDFTVFDAGVKKTCRHNQYFGVRAAQERVRNRQGGIIWHTQGSGKSLTMVWLAKIAAPIRIPVLAAAIAGFIRDRCATR